MEILIIKKLLGNTTYSIDEDSIKMNEQKMFSKKIVNIPLDTYEFNSYITSFSSKKLFWTAIIFLSLSIFVILGAFIKEDFKINAILFYISFTVIFSILYFFSKKTYQIYPTYSNALYFQYTSKTKDKIKVFMKHAHQAKIDLIRKKLDINLKSDGEDDAIGYLKNLRHNRIISDDDYLFFREELKTMSEKTSRVGFA